MRPERQWGALQISVKNTVLRGFRRRRAAYAAIASFVVVSMVGGGWVYRRYFDPVRLRDTVRVTLQPFFPGEISVGAAHLSLLGTLVITDLAVAEPRSRPTDSGESRPTPPLSDLFNCPSVEVHFRPWDLVLGRTRPLSLSLRKPTVTFRRTSSTNEDPLFDFLRGGLFNQGNGTNDLPLIAVDNARILFDVGTTVATKELALTLRARPTAADPNTWDIGWKCVSDDSAGRLQFDPQNRRIRSVSGTLPSVPIDTLLGIVDRPGGLFRRRAESLNLRGTVAVTDFDVRFDNNTSNDTLTIEFVDCALSVPIDDDEKRRDAEEPFLRFTDAKARLTLENEKLRWSAFGRLHDSEVTADGTFDLDSSTANFGQILAGSVLGRVKDLRLPRTDPDAPPEQRRFIDRIRPLASVYRDYDPRGNIDLEIQFEKKPFEDWRLEHGLVTARGGDASCRFRPYRGRNLRGTVEFTPDGVTIRGLTGEHDGGTVEVNGRVIGTTRCARCEIEVHASNLPIDDMLYNALPANFVFAVREFQLAGRVSVAMNTVRSECEGDRPATWKSDTVVSFDDLAATYLPFPYPVHNLTGKLTFDGKRMAFGPLVARHDQGKIDVSGTADVAETGLSGMDISIQGTNLALDNAILSALPIRMRDRLTAFQPSGFVDARTRIFLDPETRELQHEATVELRSVAIEHDAFPLSFNDVKGRLRVQPDRMEAEELHARFRGAEVVAQGWMSLTDNGGAWRFLSPNFTLDDAIVSGLPASWKDRLNPWHVEGPIAMEVQATKDVVDLSSDWDIEVTATLNGAVVRRDGLAHPFEDVRGMIRIDRAGIHAPALDARLDAGRIHAAFEAKPNVHGDEGTVTLAADGLRLGPWVRGLLPDRLQAAWDIADPVGVVDIRIERLAFSETEPAGRSAWSIDSQLDLKGVTFRGTPSLREVRGHITGHGPIVDRLGGCTLSGDLALDSVDILGRDVSDVHAAWSLLLATEGTARFGLDRVLGKMYGGTVTGQVEAIADPVGTRYNFSATAQDVEINPWLNAARRAQNLEPVPTDIRGEIDAHLYLSGWVGDAAPRRGGGRVEVHDARLYKLPILLAILSVLNVSMPDQQAFDEAEASFYVLGNLVDFNDISLRGPSLALLGTGSMTLPDQGVNLDLFSVNPRQWARLPGLSDLMEGTSRELVGLQVTGSVRRPIVRVKPLQGIADEFRRLFQKRKSAALRPTTG